MLLLGVIFMVFMATFLFAAYGVPFLYNIMMQVNSKRAQRFAREMERSLIQEDIKRVQVFYILGPFILGFSGLLLFPDPLRIWGALGGVVLGFILPKFYINILLDKRKRLFNDQLVDALMIMSSSFRGGLSLIQAFEAVVDEMPDPIRQEFGIVLGENKMGVSMDETLNRLYERMPSAPLQQMISAILLARETGGNLPVIFSRIVNSIRERKKIQQSIDVLTIQGKIQAFVMSVLPIVFFFLVTASNKQYMNAMFNTEIGKKLLVICAVLWVVGVVLIWKLSSLKEF